MLSLCKKTLLLLIFTVLVITTSPKETPKLSELPFVFHIKHMVNACTGSLVSKKFILTSSNCVNLFFQLHMVRVTIGNSGKYPILGIHRHPRYSIDRENNILYDVALVELVTGIDWIKPIPMALEDNKAPPGSRVIQVGWRNSSLAAIFSSVYAAKDCTNAYTNNRSFGSKGERICVGRLISCAWEESRGAPMVYKKCLLGTLTEYPEEKCDESDTLPVIYTRVASNRQWITAVMDKEKRENQHWMQIVKAVAIVLFVVLNGFLVAYVIVKLRKYGSS